MVAESKLQEGMLEQRREAGYILVENINTHVVLIETKEEV